MQQGQSQRTAFAISRWHAWAPGVQHPANWKNWLNGECSTPADVQPDVSQLPPLLRRRLDRLGRMALHTACSCLNGIDAAEFVFASRHGALQRTTDLLIALARDEPMSPTLFSVSVHNGTAGLYAIARGDRSAATAIAAGEDTLGMGLLEGAGQIAAGAAHVLMCYADDSLPPPYDAAPGSSGGRAPFSISLLLQPATQSADACYLEPAPAAAREPPEAALLRFLVEHSTSTVIGAGQCWRLQRTHRAG